MDDERHVLILGGGYVGMYTALRLQRKLRRGQARVTVVDTRGYMTYQPFLPEAAAGNVEPRHVVVPLRRVLPKARVLTGQVTGVDHAHRNATVRLASGQELTVAYDALVVALGSVARTLPIPGLREQGIGFKQIEEATALRNHVLERMDFADSTDDPAVRHRALTFVFVGGGYAGVEALAEIEDMARDACRYYRTVRPSDMRWLLVEATGRILPEVGEDMGRYTVDVLRARGVDVRLETRLVSAVDGRVVLDDGVQLDTDTLVWTAGVRPSPVLEQTDLPLDERGRVRCRPTLQVDGVDDAWAAGDCAAVPDLTREPGALCGPSAQHAVRQARVLADNLVGVLSGRRPRDYRHAHAGSVASLGLHKGVAQIKGRRATGWVAWFMHRTYHVSRMPTFNRKMRIVADWTLALFFRREVVSLGSLHDPRAAFELAATPRATDGGGQR